jgi:periplasmic divalent cation tolerance protein
MDSPIMCVITAPPDKAEAIAQDLVHNRLAACCQVTGEVRSFYHWEGELKKEAEALIFVKTRGRAVETIKARLKNIHPYAVPEFIVLPITEGNADYLAWLNENVKRD